MEKDFPDSMSVFLKTIENRLNPQQLEAVKYWDTPVLVLSGAGTGKTSTLAYKVIYGVLLRDLDISQFLILTFTNKAALEMKTRILDLLESYNYSVQSKSLYIETFHSICVKILRWHANVLGYTRYFSISAEEEQTSLIKRLIKEHNLNVMMKPKEIRERISHFKNDFLTPQDVVELAQSREDDELEKYANLYALYQEEMHRSNAMDFDDIQINVIRLLQKEKDICHFWQNQFKGILVDEFQDTNKVQYLLLQLLGASSPQSHTTFVGDDDQSIYSFRGANIGNILNLQHNITDLKIIRLEENYRSTPDILALANHSIRYNNNRLGKELYTNNARGNLPELYIASTDEEEVQFCLEKIEELDLQKESVAIIYRTHHQSKIFERELLRAGKSYQLLGGRKFLQKKEILDILAYLRLILNPEDNLSFRRIINIPARGVGEVMIQKIIQYAKTTHQSEYNVLKNIIDTPDFKISPKTKKILQDFVLVIEQLTVDISSPNLLGLLIESIDYKHYLEYYDKDERKTQERYASLDELERAYLKILDDGGSLENFIEYFSLVDSSDTSHSDNESHLFLTTIHGCKGLEFDYVFVVGLVEEIFPHYLSIETLEQLEEERRLLYVAMTRAKKKLFLSAPSKMLRHGQWEFFYQSRFLQEMHSHLLKTTSHIADDSRIRDIKKWYEDLL